MENNQAPLKKGVIEKKPSGMLGVSRPGAGLPDTAQLVSRLKSASFLRIVRLDDTGIPARAVIEYKKERYSIVFGPREYTVPVELFKVTHQLDKTDSHDLRTATGGMMLVMKFGRDAVTSFHLQLKLMCLLLPDCAGIVDFDSQRIHSAKWAKLAADSVTPPAASYLYSLQAVTGEHSGSVWLHTHGLNRCGIIELEILDSSKYHYRQHAIVMGSVACRAVCENTMPDEQGKIFAGTLQNGSYITVTWMDWEEDYSSYSSKLPGGIADHNETHSKNSGILYVYRSAADEEHGLCDHISCFDDDFGDDSAALIPARESARMKALAAERLPWARKGFDSGMKTLVKLALDTDENKREDCGPKEYVWFTVTGFDDNQVTGTALSDASYISGLVKGSEAAAPLSDITDWAMNAKGLSVTPDTVYLMEL